RLSSRSIESISHRPRPADYRTWRHAAVERWNALRWIVTTKGMNPFDGRFHLRALEHACDFGHRHASQVSKCELHRCHHVAVDRKSPLRLFRWMKEPVTAHERRFGIDCAAIHLHHVFAACVCHDDGAGRERRYGGQCEKATSVDGHGESVKRFPPPRDAVSVP